MASAPRTPITSPCLIKSPLSVTTPVLPPILHMKGSGPSPHWLAFQSPRCAVYVISLCSHNDTLWNWHLKPPCFRRLQEVSDGAGPMWVGWWGRAPLQDLEGFPEGMMPAWIFMDELKAPGCIRGQRYFRYFAQKLRGGKQPPVLWK